jgi:hypothetical protein
MHGASRVDGDRGQDGHGVPRFRASRLRGVLRPPYGAWPRVRDVLLPCDGVLLPAYTLISLPPVADLVQPGEICLNRPILARNCYGRVTGG